MSGTFDPRGDFAAVADATQTVTLRRRTGGQTLVAGALRRATTARHVDPSGGYVGQADAVFHLPVANLAEPPEPGDWILDGDAVAWTVLRVDRHVVTGRWRCTGRNVAVAADLDQRVAVESATFVPGAHGDAECRWQLWKANLPARIQPLASVPTSGGVGQMPRQTHWIYLAESPPRDRAIRVLDSSGRVYHVDRVEQAEQLGRPVRLQAHAAETGG